MLSIGSDPPGAVVFINNERRGATPTRITGLPTDCEISVRLEAEGFRVWQQKMQIDNNAPVRSLQAGLYPLQACREGEGWLYVSTEPKGATVELDGKRFPGATPMIIDKICAGQSHTLRLQAIGYRPWLSGEVEVASDQVKNVNVSLEK